MVKKEPKSRRVSAGTCYTFEGRFRLDITHYDDTRWSFHIHHCDYGPGNALVAFSTFISEMTEARDWIEAHAEPPPD